MKKKKAKYLLEMFIFFVFMVIINSTESNAASASISTSSSATVNSPITISVSGSAVQWNLSLKVGDTTIASSQELDNYEENKTISFSGTYTPTTTGTIEIKLEGSITDVDGTTTRDFSTKTVTVSNSDANPDSDANVNASANETPVATPTTTATTKSSVATLSMLGITPNDFSGFKVNTTTYNVTVPNDVEQVTVYATLSDSNASLTGTGVHKLSVGENALSVVVTAQDGKTKKTYTINVTREAETETDEDEESDEETDNEETEEVAETATNASSGDLIKLEVTGYTLSPEFSSDIFEYTLSLNGDASSLDIITEGANHNVSIEIVGNEDLQEGENIITILVFNEETEENSTYQIVVNKTNVDLEGINTSLNDAVNNANMIRYILLGIIIFIIICVIIFLIVRKKYIAKRDADTIYEYDEEDVDNLAGKFNLDEEDDLFSRVNQEANKDSVQDDFNEISKNENEIDENVSDDDVPKENVSDEDTEEREEYFSTGGAKKKGRHF